MSSFASASVPVKVKWGKNSYDVAIDPAGGVMQFKAEIYSLTGVPVDRQKLMAKGAWMGVLKDDADLASMALKPGMAVMLMGSADVVAAPAAPVMFVEDMTAEEKAEKGASIPGGLANLQNTCYMNATVECFRHMPELRSELARVRGGTPAANFVVAFREMLNAVDSAGRSFPPVMFVTQLRSQFPQFAQTSPQSGGYMQQDAEEFYNVLAMSISSALEATGVDGARARDSLLNMQADETISCTECPEEPVTSRRVSINRLVCNIQGGHGSSTVINHLHEGLRLGLNSSVEKHSAILGRNAEWGIRQQLAKLPRFLCVQFMRFFWKATPESRDHTGVKCKILRPVTFQETFDVFEFCSDSLKERLRFNRQRKNQRDEAELAMKRQKLTNDSSSASSSSVASSGDPQLSAMLQTAATMADVPSAMEVSPMLNADDAAHQEHLNKSLEAVSGGDSETLNTTVPLSDHFGAGLPEGFTGSYELMGVVTHKGRSADSGHYIGWVRQGPGSEYWWKYDDDTVTEVNTAEILNLKGGGDWHTAYLNFYRFKE